MLLKNGKYSPELSAPTLTMGDSLLGNTLIRATYRGKVHRMKRLLRDGADPSGRDCHGWTPLHWAASKGHNEAIACLIENDADVNATDLNGWSPLHLAAINNERLVAEILLKAGASCTMKDKFGDVPKDCVRKDRKRLLNTLDVDADKMSESSEYTESSCSDSYDSF